MRLNVTVTWLPLFMCAACLPAQAEPFIRSRADLQYGTVLFEYYQHNYFNGLVEHAYAAAMDNPRAGDNRGQLLKGSMALSYRVPAVAEAIFDRILAANTDEDIRNRAWYYLAKLYYSRSKPAQAFAALERIHGTVPADLHLDYHYLATLVNNEGKHLRQVQEGIGKIPATNAHYPYLLFNLGVSYLNGGDRAAAVRNLSTVVNAADRSEELQVLADRARHGLARIAIQDQRLPEAWIYLQDIRAEGLYSNRALLAYAWTAIRQELFQTALPALQLLSNRSIALPEVQECKVLLGHVHEQQGAITRALKSHLEAEAAFSKGLQQVAEARRIVEQDNLPREFIASMEAIADVSGWQGTPESEGYDKLAPFLVDLMASKVFHQILEELRDLYAIRDNLSYWALQTDQHELILNNAAAKVFDEKMQQLIQDSTRIHTRLANQRQELGLFTLILHPREQERFNALLENASRELARLDDTVQNLQRQSEPYRQPPAYPAMVARHHRRIGERQRETEQYIARLEPVMRKLAQAELDKHEARMRYYLAQARLAKARLYDTALTELNQASAPVTEANRGGSSP